MWTQTGMIDLCLIAFIHVGVRRWVSPARQLDSPRGIARLGIGLVKRGTAFFTGRFGEPFGHFAVATSSTRVSFASVAFRPLRAFALTDLMTIRPPAAVNARTS